MTAQPTLPIPAIEDFRSEDEILIRFLDDDPDTQGRRHFLTFWLDGNLKNGVRGQRHHGEPAAFTARTERDGGSVRVIES